MGWQILLGFLYFLLCFFLVCILSTRKPKMKTNWTEVASLKGLPILGMVPLLKSPLYRYLMSLRTIYGKLFKIRVGTRDVVVVNDFKMSKRLIDDNEEHTFRSWLSGLSKLVDNKRLIDLPGGQCLTQHAFVSGILNRFLLENSKLESIVQCECQSLLVDLDNMEGRSTDISTLINLYTANILTRITLNKRFASQENKSKACQKAITVGMKNRDIVSLIYLMFPRFENSTLISKIIYYLFRKLKIFEDLNHIFNEELVEHVKLLDSHGEDDDFIYQCLIEQNKLIDENGKGKRFVDEELLLYAYQFITDGYKTVASMLEWSLVFMSKYPDIQERVHNEIVEVIGHERMPLIEDKEALNYTQAVMDEILRLGSPTPLRNIYKVLRNTKIEGLTVQPNNLILINTHACNTDPMVWSNPLDFNPQNFLTNSDVGSTKKYFPKEELVVYGLDKRQCFGEKLCQSQFFIFFVSFLQRFQISFGEEMTDNKYQETLQESDGIHRSPNVHQFIFKPYNC